MNKLPFFFNGVNRDFTLYAGRLRAALNFFWLFAHHANFTKVEHALSEENAPKNANYLESSKNVLTFICDTILDDSATKGDVMLRVASMRAEFLVIFDRLQKLESDFSSSIRQLRYHGLYAHKKYYEEKNREPFLTGADSEYYAMTNKMYKQMAAIGRQFVRLSLQTQAVWKRYGKT